MPSSFAWSSIPNHGQMKTQEVCYAAAFGVRRVLGLAEAAPAAAAKPRGDFPRLPSLYRILDLNIGWKAAEAEVGVLAAFSRPSRESDDLRWRHPVAVLLVRRIVDKGSGLEQKPAMEIIRAALLVVALQAGKLDNALDPLEGQVECPAPQPGDQVAGLFRTPRAGMQVVMNC